MTHLTRLVAVFALAAGVAAAQPPGPPSGGALDIERLAVLLDLDAYQKGEVERVLQEQRAARLAAREERLAAREERPAPSERPSPEELRARREQGRDELFGKLANTLTEQQITKLKLLMEPAQGLRGPRGRPAGPF